MRLQKVMKLKTFLSLVTSVAMIYIFTHKSTNVRNQSREDGVHDGNRDVKLPPNQNLNVVPEKIPQNQEDIPNRCPYGYFRLPGMTNCHPWLNCSHIKDVNSIVPMRLNLSHVKQVSLGLWRNHKVVLSTVIPRLRNLRYLTIDVIKEFQPSLHIVQLVGLCNYTYITEYHPYGDALKLEKVFQLGNLKSKNNLKTRLQMCVSYIEVIHHLHTMPGGPRVFCDSPNLQHTLTQFLITRHLHLVLADLDFLYQANSILNQSTDCYALAFNKSFNPPECFKNPRKLDDRFDVWKIPDVCDHFIGHLNSSVVLHDLTKIKFRCKERNPLRRPTSGEVLSAYRQVLYEVMKNT